MASSKNLAQHHNGVRGGSLRVRSVWRGIGREARRIASLLGLEIIGRSDAVCFALAVLVSALVIVPAILIFGDRTQPFQYVDSIMVEKTASPGDKVHFRLTVRRVSKTCRGTVDRVFIDSSGRVFPLRTERTAYQYFPDEIAVDGKAREPLRVVERSWHIPEEASFGEGTYASFPEFWCYPLQFLYPIAGVPVRARVVVMPRGQHVPDGAVIVPNTGFSIPK